MSLAAALACLLGVQEDLDVLLYRLDHDDPVVRAEAFADLRGRGAAAMPALERALGDPSPERRGRAEELLLRLPDYALRALIRLPEYPEVRRLWTAVVEAVVWKRPIPAGLGVPTEMAQEELREAVPKRNHRPVEILAGLREAALDLLCDLVEEVGMEGAPVDLRRARRLLERGEPDFLDLVRRAEPDPVSFEEVYGTLALLEGRSEFRGTEDWSRDDWALAVKLLVHLRRRPGAAFPGAEAAREDVLALAVRGPLVRGMADALGRAFANRELVLLEALQKQEQAEAETNDETRRIYGVLVDMDRWIGGAFYMPELLRPAKPAVPKEAALVPAARRGFFDRAAIEGQAQRRVAAELLRRAGEPPWAPRDEETAVRLFRAVTSLVAGTSP